MGTLGLPVVRHFTLSSGMGMRVPCAAPGDQAALFEPELLSGDLRLPRLPPTMRKPVLHVVQAQGLSILRQLRLEEALLRADPERRNWCVLNAGTEEPAAVMGISGKAEELLYVEEVRRQGLPVIRRFSGGGTVVVDHRTLFVTLICSAQAFPALPLYPRPIMKWTEELYRPMFPPEAHFGLLETDYALGNLKFGGNAQAITKNRWLHHSSLLWDFDEDQMARVLQNPKKAPDYRQKRSHKEFLCTLRPLFPTMDGFHEDFLAKCLPPAFEARHVPLAEALALTELPHVSMTKLVELE